MSKNQMQE